MQSRTAAWATTWIGERGHPVRIVAGPEREPATSRGKRPKAVLQPRVSRKPRRARRARMAKGRADGSGLPLLLRKSLQLPERTWGPRPMPTARERPGARRSAFACGLRVRARLKLLGTPPDFV